MNATLSIALVAATASLWPASTPAQTVEEFYRSKSVTMLIGSGAGGGYDTYARIFARHMSRYIPGNPTIIAKNMPAAAGLAAANTLYTTADKDGSTIAAFTNGSAMEPLFGNASSRYDAQKFNWLGSIGKLQNVCATWHQSSIKTIAAARAREVIVAAAGAAADQHGDGLALVELFDRLRTRAHRPGCRCEQYRRGRKRAGAHGMGSPLARVFLRHRREVPVGPKRLEQTGIHVVLDLLAAAGELGENILRALPRDFEIARRLRLEVVVGDVEDFRITDLEFLGQDLFRALLIGQREIVAFDRPLEETRKHIGPAGDIGSTYDDRAEHPRDLFGHQIDQDGDTLSTGEAGDRLVDGRRFDFA